MTYSIFPSVGVARIGNSEGQFYLAPDAIGGLPYEADEFGNKTDARGCELGSVKNFKDAAGQVRRQGQLFQIFDENGNELTLNSPNVESIEWNVHLANKKAAWYEFHENQGNLLYGEDNSYASRKTPPRNPNVTGDNPNNGRQTLIIDPGPRVISGKNQQAEFSKSSPSNGYPTRFPKKNVDYGTNVTTLGSLTTDNEGRLVVIGAYGHAGGNTELSSYGGANTWHDDIADGPVYATVTFVNGYQLTLKAWVIVGSPDFAPEIVNISNLSDTMLDVAIRHKNLIPELCNNGEFNPGYIASFKRDILPIIERIKGYQWVANIQSMSAFFSNIFDFTDNSEPNKTNRQAYFSYFRDPKTQSEQLFDYNNTGAIPLMPMNSGSNSVSNVASKDPNETPPAGGNIVDKFLSLNQTQYFLLSQWAEGNFVNDDTLTYPGVDPKNEASVGNCVGLPMCPGIEATWSMQNPNIYAEAFQIADRKGINGYQDTGLDPSRDECEGGGCEPGDLTKRMACPWQADFFNCTIQYVNFTDPKVNKVQDEDGNWAPLPPSYYSYWWPPQSPWDVLTGEITAKGQALSHLPMGEQVNFARGINSFNQMVEHWSALAFIRNVNTQSNRFPYFVETERNHELFSFKSVGVGSITTNPADNETEIPVFYIPDNSTAYIENSARGAKLVEAMEKRAFKALPTPTGDAPLPRSGTRRRR